ncbi:unnamed protein product [Gadus morhua 'NCC']
MSQWKQIQQLEVGLLEHVDYLYNDNFPMDVRQGLADWIEGQDWETAERNESMAAMLFTNLLGQLERSCAQEPNFLQRHNLKIIHQQLQMKYNTNPGLIARVISNCLREERRILSSACMQQQGPLENSMPNSVTLEKQKNMDNRVAIIRSSVQLMDQAVKYIEDMQDEFDLRYKTLQSRDPAEKTTERMKEEVIRLQEMLNRLDFKRKEILSKMGDVIKEVDSLVTCDLHPELLEWRRRQQVSIIGGPLLTGLDLLQNWFTGTAHSLFQIKRQLDKLGELVVKVTYEGDPIPLQTPHMAETVRCLVYLVIKSSFVVEVQPCMPTHPQRSLIIKTGVQFTTKVRLLVKLPEVDYQLKVKTTFDKDLPPGRLRIACPGNSSGDIQVSWSKFSKENITGKAFSFWIWLESILELIRKHLLPVWNDNYIMGFVSKEKERALLKGKEGGTFLLRFSESHLGGITFTWVEQADNGESNFTSVEPYTKSRLIALPFADILRNYKVISEGLVTDNPLKFLYPNIPKDEAFSRYYNSPQSKVHPYLSANLIPISELPSNGSVPLTHCSSPEPPMSPGVFQMLHQQLCFDTMSPPYSE